MLHRLSLPLAVLVIVCPSLSVAADIRYSVTVYSHPSHRLPAAHRNPNQPVPGYALIRQEQDIALTARDNDVRIANVAAHIDPTTVSFVSLTDAAGTRVLEQNYEYDLVSSARVLERYIDRKITVEQTVGDTIRSLSGRLLSAGDGLTLETDDGTVQIVRNATLTALPRLPGGLITKPTLTWRLTADQPGTHRARISYQTTGMTWWADYNLLLVDPPECKLDLAAWVSIVNESGAGYPQATLKLVAGDVARLTDFRPQVMQEMDARRVQSAAAGFEQKPFFEYHLYTLDRATSLPDRSTKQLELFPRAHGIPCTKRFVFAGLPGLLPRASEPILDRVYASHTSPAPVSVFLQFTNDDASNLGLPLPQGRVRVNQLDTADDSLQFIGEAAIDHTPRDASIDLRLGSAFDVRGERIQTDFRIDRRAQWMEETVQVRIRNSKDTPITVSVQEPLYRWSNWSITQTSHDYAQRDAHTAEFALPVPARSENSVRYTVRYSW